AEHRIVLDRDGGRAVPRGGRVERLGAEACAALRDRGGDEVVAGGAETVVCRVVVRARADNLRHADRNGRGEWPLVTAAGAYQADPARARFDGKGLDLLGYADGPAVAPRAHGRIALAESEPVDRLRRIHAVVDGARDVAVACLVQRRIDVAGLPAALCGVQIPR